MRMCVDVCSKLVSVKPPPMSRMLGLKPRAWAWEKTIRAWWMAFANAWGFFAPVPGTQLSEEVDLRLMIGLDQIHEHEI